MKTYLPEKKHLLVLIALSLVSLALLIWRFHDSSDAAPVMRVLPSGPATLKQEEMVLKNLPEPGTFKAFMYRGEAEKEVELTCLSAYATLLIYPHAVDYRFDPLGAKFNTAYECEGKGKMKRLVPLASAHLENGVEYYMIRAHQNTTGLWYDPY